MKAVGTWIGVMAVFVMPALAIGQQRGIDAAQVDRRLSGLQQQLADLAAHIDRLKAQDQQLQQQMKVMRASLDARLERLEKGASRPGRR
jgi:TolA-binding protein